MSDSPLSVVTGASSGIGEAYTEALAARGHRVLAVARRADRLHALAARRPGRIVPVVTDLTRPAAAGEIVARAGELGPVELLVDNAGRAAFGPLAKSTPELAQEMVQLNVMAGVDLVTRLLPGMVDRGRGGIVLVSSSVAYYPTPNLAVYNATKAFLLSFAESLSLETDGTGVRVMALCPGPTSSEFGDTAGMADMLDAAPGLMDPAGVVAEAMRAFDRGRTVCLPGRLSRAMTPVLAHLPRPVRRRAAARMFAG